MFTDSFFGFSGGGGGGGTSTVDTEAVQAMIDDSIEGKADKTFVELNYLTTTAYNENQFQNFFNPTTSVFYPKTETYSITEANNLLNGKLSTTALNDYYNKTTTDTALSGKVDTAALDDYYKKADTYSRTEANNLLNGKLSTTALNDYYNKTTTDTALSGKVDTAALDDYYKKVDTYSKIEIDDLLTENGTDLSAYYTMTDTDALLDTKADRYAPFVVRSALKPADQDDSNIYEFRTLENDKGKIVIVEYNAMFSSTTYLPTINYIYFLDATQFSGTPTPPDFSITIVNTTSRPVLMTYPTLVGPQVINNVHHGIELISRYGYNILSAGGTCTLKSLTSKAYTANNGNNNVVMHPVLLFGNLQATL